MKKKEKKNLRKSGLLNTKGKKHLKDQLCQV